MDPDTPEFDSLWRRHDNFAFSERTAKTCRYAELFAQWCRELLTAATGNASVISINQSKVLLVDKYFEWRNSVPKSHRNYLGSEGGHVCIFQVFDSAYRQLRAVELALTPPLLFLPAPPPPPPPPPQIAGIFLGEEQ